MSNPLAPWFQMSSDQKREEIIKRRRNNESFAQIAKELLGSPKNKSTIWSWAKRNLSEADIYPRMASLPSEPYGSFSDVEQWV
ncbi:MAG: helix-turn-helix domain-containing protein, partial [Candidatus Hodarchaeota archaeon]